MGTALKILAVDATSAACSVALLNNGEVREQFVQAERDHTRRLLPMVDQLLAESELTLNSVDALAVSRGPGSFTGLRIAISCVQGLAFAAEKPVIPVSSLAALAAGAVRIHPQWQGAPVAAVLDARMQEVYWGLYNSDAPNQCLQQEAVQPPAQVAEQLHKINQTTPTYAIGSGLHYEQLTAIKVSAQDSECHIHAWDIAQLGFLLWSEGAAITAEALHPTYLRDNIAHKQRRQFCQK